MHPGIRNLTVDRRSRFGRGGKILFVDEDLQDLYYLCRVLREQGRDPVPCESYAEAMRHLEVSRFEFVVVSQGSYAFEGRCVLERAIEIDRYTPVLVLTRCHNMNCYLDAMQLGAVDYLEKPIQPEEIARVVGTHLGHGCTAA